MHCNAATMVVPQWTEDVAKSYLGDQDSDKLLKKVAADTDQNPKFSLNKGLLKYKNMIYVGASTDFRKQLCRTCEKTML